MISYNKPTVFFSIPETIVSDLDKLGGSSLVCDDDNFLSWMNESQKYKEKEKLYLLFAEQVEELARILKNVYENSAVPEKVECDNEVHDEGERIRSSALAQAIYSEFEKEGIKAHEEKAAVMNGQDFISMLCALKGLLFRIYYNDKGYWIDNKMCIAEDAADAVGMVIANSEDLLTELSGHESLEYLPFAYEEVLSQEELLKKLDASIKGDTLCIGEWKRVANSTLALLGANSENGEGIKRVIIDNLTSPTTLPFSKLKSVFKNIESIDINHIPSMSILNFYNETHMEGIKQITILSCAASSVKGVNNIPKGTMIKIWSNFLSKEDIAELNKTGRFDITTGAEEMMNSALKELETRVFEKKVGQPFNGKELFNELFNCNLQIYPSSLLVRITRNKKEDWKYVETTHYAAASPGEYHCLFVYKLIGDKTMQKKVMNIKVS